MEYLIDRLKKDLAKIQTTIKKEGETLVQKIQELDFTKNFAQKKKQLEKMALENIKKIEPLCHQITLDFANKVKKAALDLNSLEEKLRSATNSTRLSFKNSDKLKKKVKKATEQVQKSVSSFKKKASKKIVSEKNTLIKTPSKKKTEKKVETKKAQAKKKVSKKK